MIFDTNFMYQRNVFHTFQKRFMIEGSFECGCHRDHVVLKCVYLHSANNVNNIICLNECVKKLLTCESCDLLSRVSRPPFKL